MTNEPTVLDYFKSLLTPWKGAPLTIPGGEEPEAAVASAPAHQSLAVESQPFKAAGEALAGEKTLAAAAAMPWRALVALLLGLIGQAALGPQPDRDWTLGVFFYLLAAGWVAWAYLKGDWLLDERLPTWQRLDPQTYRRGGVVLGGIASLLVLLTSGGNLFHATNLFLLILACAGFLFAFWLPQEGRTYWRKNLASVLLRPVWEIKISRWTLLVAGAFLVAAFFRFYRLAEIPAEMVSDHAEKYQDVADVLAGATRIFFPNNGGREAMQFYLLASLVNLGLPMSFLTLKLSTTLIGFASLPFIYLLGKEAVNRRVGLFALIFAGILYWPNVVARAGMRLPFVFLFTAATLYFLLRGLKSGSRNQFILAGIVLGLGFYGYSANRILPLMVVAAVGIYWLHTPDVKLRRQTVLHLFILGLFAMVLFLPLLRYAIDDPQGYAFRTITRMGSAEQPLSAPAWQIFLKNNWRALTMFAWDDGEVWVVSLPHYPALGIIAGGLFHLGVVLAFVRYLKQRTWLDLFWIVSIPILMLPSTLALAFPNENPNLYRAGGALIPVLMLMSTALDGLLTSFGRAFPRRFAGAAACGLAVVLVFFSARQEYDLVFNQYARSYQLSAWNTSEIGQVVRAFESSFGSFDQAYLVAFPHWVDSRLAAIQAGHPGDDFAIWPEQFPETVNEPGAKLFIINLTDQAAIQALEEIYPEGSLQIYDSKVENKDFWMYYVPAGS